MCGRIHYLSVSVLGKRALFLEWVESEWTWTEVEAEGGRRQICSQTSSFVREHAVFLLKVVVAQIKVHILLS